MTRSVALLHGINVGGNAKVPMAVLREVFAAAGATDVVTLLNSGNVVFSGTVQVTDLEARVSAATGVSPRILLVDAPRLRRILDAFPFTGDESRLLVSFMDTVPSGIDIPGDIEPELFALGPEAAYQSIPAGVSQTKLKPAFWRQFPPETTARNLRTVRKIATLLDA